MGEIQNILEYIRQNFDTLIYEFVDTKYKIMLISVLFLIFISYQCSADNFVSIGVLLNNLPSQIELPLKSSIYKKNIVDRRANFSSHIQVISNTDSFEASKTLCNMINTNNGNIAIIGVDSSQTIPIQESISVNFELPYITVSWRGTPLREYDTILNFYPEAERFARGLAEVVRSLRWKSFVIIYETEEGLIRMQDILKLQEFKREGRRNSILVKQLGPGPDYRPLLKKIRNSTEDNIILDCDTKNIIPILLQAKNLEMLSLHNNYFITSLDAHTLDFSILNTTANITTVRLFDYDDENFKNIVQMWMLADFQDSDRTTVINTKSVKTETALFYDALLLLMDSINDLSVTSTVQSNPISCNSSEKSIDGFRIYNYMRIRVPSLTLTGPLKFDENGNRIDFNIHAVDILREQTIATWFASNESIFLNRNSNETFDATVSNLQKIKVIVSSRLGEPYLMRREPNYEGEILTGNARYKGYSMDLIAGVARIIGFEFEFRLAEDKKYGNWDPEKKRWTGLVGDLLERKAHLALCDLTITHERREVVDFSMPFMTLGISILYKKPDKKDINMFAFLDPFSMSVWIYTATLYLIISIVLYFISRMTPGNWENPHPCDENPEELENIWDLKNCFWLTLGSIMTQGCDILPKGISSRTAVSMWWFFSLIMTSSYTANLAAFLTKANLEPPIDSAEALAKQTKIKYGLLEGGSTESFFKNSNFSTYQRMWLNMQQSKPSVFEKNNADGVQRVQTTKNGLYAFLMESTQIEYEVETKCDLKQVGNWLDTKSYGIAMPMNSPYRSAINKAVLKMQESGELGELKKKWWKTERDKQSCDTLGDEGEEDGAELALANVGGVFLVLGVGIGIAFLLAILEFLWNVKNVSVEEHLTYWEALQVELRFACNIWITKKRTKPLISESSSASDKTDKTDNKSMIHSILHSTGSFMNLNI